ncbi:MAG: TolC family protein [Kiritimatiellae bacterium]|nr:TolC family protein [Kiritimatiellia bacterium]
MKRNKLFYISIMMLIAFSVPGYAGNETKGLVGEIGLNQALKLARECNPDILSAQYELQAAVYRKAQAGVRPNPNLSFEAENVLGKNELKGFDSAEYTAQLEQTLETGGKRSKRVQKAELDRQLSLFDLSARQLDVEAETARRFAVVQGAQEQLALSREFMTLAEDFLKAVSARVQAGTVSPMEGEKAKMLWAQQKASLFQSERELDSARVQLSAMWGSVKPQFDRVSGEFFKVPQLNSIRDLTIGLKDNPDVGRWNTELEQRKAALKTEKAVRIPDVSIAGGVRRFNDTGDDAFVLGLSLPLPLFDRNQGNVREAATLISMAEKQRLSAVVSANTALAEAYQRFLSVSTKVTILKTEIIPRATSIYDSMMSGYRQGKFSYLEVLEARRTLFEVRGEYIAAMVSCHGAVADVERIAGFKNETNRR